MPNDRYGGGNIGRQGKPEPHLNKVKKTMKKPGRGLETGKFYEA